MSYTPEWISEVLAEAKRRVNDPRHAHDRVARSIACNRRALIEIIEQLRAESADRLAKLNAAVAEAEELRDERNALSLELRCAKDRLAEVDAENVRLKEHESKVRALCEHWVTELKLFPERWEGFNAPPDCYTETYSAAGEEILDILNPKEPSQ